MITGVVASLSSTDVSVERAARIHGCPLAQTKRERAGRASRPRASGVNARQRHSEGFGTCGPIEARDQAVRIYSEGTTSARDENPRYPPSHERYLSLNTRCAASAGWSATSLEGLAPRFSRANVPSGTKSSNFLRGSHWWS